jgi:hypothetical protein
VPRIFAGLYQLTGDIKPNLLEGARPSLVRLDIDGDLEPIIFESLRAYTEQEQTTARITATLEGEPMVLTRGVWSATNVQLA